MQTTNTTLSQGDIKANRMLLAHTSLNHIRRCLASGCYISSQVLVQVRVCRHYKRHAHSHINSTYRSVISKEIVRYQNKALVRMPIEANPNHKVECDAGTVRRNDLPPAARSVSSPSVIPSFSTLSQFAPKYFAVILRNARMIVCEHKTRRQYNQQQQVHRCSLQCEMVYQLGNFELRNTLHKLQRIHPAYTQSAFVVTEKAI